MGGWWLSGRTKQCWVLGLQGQREDEAPSGADTSSFGWEMHLPKKAHLSLKAGRLGGCIKRLTDIEEQRTIWKTEGHETEGQVHFLVTR